MSLDVFTIGNAITDLQVRVDDDLLAGTGYDKGIMTLVESDVQSRLMDSLSDHDCHRVAGGSAANTAAAIAHLGGTSAFLGKIGADEFGEFYVGDLRKAGVVIDVQPTDAAHTGTCAILITPDAERTMMTHLGAATHLGVDDVDAKAESLIAESKYVYIEGYLLTGGGTKAAAMATIALAKKHGVPVALTASDPFLVGMMRDELLTLIDESIDLLFCNEEEALGLADKDNMQEAAAMLAGHVDNLAITLGGAGSMLIHGGTTERIDGVRVKAIDTTGAGDVYAAGLLYGLTHGQSWADAGKLASQSAAKIVAQMGPRFVVG